VGEDDDMELVQQYIDAKHDVLETATEGQFSAERFCIMLLPGDYPDLDVKVGYYTSVIGLGEHPEDVAIKSLYVSTKVLMQHMVICNFSGNEDSSIERLINDYGQGVGKDNFRSLVKKYPFNY